MKDGISEKKLAENQVFFRGLNAKVREGIENIKQVADEDGSKADLIDENTVFEFHCECSHNHCLNRIKISLADYEAIHKDNASFTITPGHNIPEVEDVTFTCPAYCVVTKHKEPPKKVTTVHPIDQ
ncbi:MAG: hypothetical protein JWN33_447 [Candidatus Saccharibacteria bacterium]|nr:hypothetical protein [Candidatus Saccharibacteria bacterium]